MDYFFLCTPSRVLFDSTEQFFFSNCNHTSKIQLLMNNPLEYVRRRIQNDTTLTVSWQYITLPRFDPSQVSSLRIRFKNELCLPLKRTLHNELSLVPTNDSIQALPIEIILMIALRIKEPNDMIRFGLTCRKHISVIEEESFWKSLVKR